MNNKVILPIEIINHILSFRPTHPTAKCIKQFNHPASKCMKEWLEIFKGCCIYTYDDISDDRGYNFYNWFFDMDTPPNYNFAPTRYDFSDIVDP